MTTFYRSAGDYNSYEPPHMFESGWSYLNKHYKPYKEALHVVTGTPGSGKTLFLVQQAMQLFQIHKHKTVLFLFENDAGDVRYQMEDFCHAEKIDYNEMAQSVCLVEHDSDTQPTIGWVKETLEQLQMEHDFTPDWAMIDPWNQIEMDRPQLSLEQQQKADLATIKRYFKRRHIGLFIAAHPTKDVKQADGTTRAARGYDISGSAHWMNASDYVLCLSRLRDPDTLEWSDTADLIIDKVKKQGRRTGLNTGKASLTWSNRALQFLAGKPVA